MSLKPKTKISIVISIASMIFIIWPLIVDYLNQPTQPTQEELDQEYQQILFELHEIQKEYLELLRLKELYLRGQLWIA